MSFLGIFSSSEISKIEEELALLKQDKLLQDRARLEGYERQFVNASDAQKLALLHPIVKVMVRRTLIQGKLAGLKFGIHTGGRLFSVQDVLYHQGRTFENGAWVITDRDLVVTNAPAGLSWHQYFVAVDFVMDGDDKPGYQWTWNNKIDADKDGKNDWTELGKIAESNGLTWGGRWKYPIPIDTPHVEYHSGIDKVQDALVIYKESGLSAVWQKIV